MSGSKRLTIHSKNLFLLILLVGVLSLAFHINLGYYELFVEDRTSISGPMYAAPELRIPVDDVKVLGRSLNQHESKTYKSKGSGSHDSSVLLKRLERLERMMSQSRTKPVLAVMKENGKHVLENSTKPIKIIKHSNNGGLTWVDEETVIQGNWSLLLCLDGTGCTQAKPDVSQKVNQIEELTVVSMRPDFLCTLANLEEKKIGRRHVCTNHYTETDEISAPSLVVRPHGTPEYIEDRPNNSNVYGATVWPLYDKPMAFRKGGQLLRIKTFISSLSPLRFYINPVLTVGHFYDQNEMILSSLDDVLQSISELYGLGTASRWWTTIQSVLLTTMLHFENEVVSNYYDIDRCKRCFHVFDVEIICSSVQNCYIIQMIESKASTAIELETILKFVQGNGSVVGDVSDALDHSELCDTTQECDDVFDDTVLTDNILIYLMDWRLEMEQTSNWIPIYPSNTDMSELKEIVQETGWDTRLTRKLHDLLTDITGYYNGLEASNQQELQYVVEEAGITMDSFLEQVSRDPKYKCSDDSEDVGKLDTIITYPKVFVEKVSDTLYNITVDYHMILLRIRAVQKCCACEARLENKFNEPGARNITLGLGETVLRIYMVDIPSNLVLNVITLTITRNRRGSSNIGSRLPVYKETEIFCGFKQDCSMLFDTTGPCGLYKVPYTQQTQQRCTSGDTPGHWVVPCANCQSEDSCDWTRAVWQPIGCSYDNLSPTRLKEYLNGKKLLFIGDSTNRGVSNYIIEQINDTLHDWDKTHSSKVYYNVNNNRTQFTFAYYPHFWLPVNHRPTFRKVIYQLIKSSLPLENNSNTVIVVGGVHWLAKQHVDLIIEALQRKGLSGITKVMKGIGAGFHQPVEGVRYVSPAEQPSLQQREHEVLQYAKQHGFHVVATFNMTISRYKDFLEGQCACHFHKVSRIHQDDNLNKNQYTVQGYINSAYSQILLNQICDK